MSVAEALVLGRMAEVARVLTLDTRMVWRWASAGVLPWPIRLGSVTRHEWEGAGGLRYEH